MRLFFILFIFFFSIPILADDDGNSSDSEQSQEGASSTDDQSGKKKDGNSTTSLAKELGLTNSAIGSKTNSDLAWQQGFEKSLSSVNAENKKDGLDKEDEFLRSEKEKYEEWEKRREEGYRQR